MSDKLLVTKLRQILREKDWSSRKLAREIGISESYMSRIFCRQRRLTLNVVARIVRRFPEAEPEALAFFRDHFADSGSDMKEEPRG